MEGPLGLLCSPLQPFPMDRARPHGLGSTQSFPASQLAPAPELKAETQACVSGQGESQLPHVSQSALRFEVFQALPQGFVRSRPCALAEAGAVQHRLGSSWTLIRAISRVLGRQADPQSE